MSQPSPELEAVLPPAERDARYAAVQDYLFSLKAKGVRFGIDRMSALTAAMGHPERALPIVHIAGTNGKGSTGAMLESILRAAGRRTGLYTSPHLVRLGERVQVNRTPLTEAEIVAYTDELRPLAERVSRYNPDDHASFFEFMTAMAFLQFARRRCDLAVIEVGMGGRLDATNVVLPEVSVITSISLDHCAHLGDTPEKIAAEKAGIIKHGRPVVIGRLTPGAERVVRMIAAAQEARVISVREEFGDDVERYPTTSLEGEYQRWNAATATLVARALPESWRPDEASIARGLMAVDWPGRWQHVQAGDRHVILDASHNPEGAAVLDTNLTRLIAKTGRRPVIVAGVLGADRADSLMKTVGRHAREIYLVVPQQARACTHEELTYLLPESTSGRILHSTVTGLFPSPGVCLAGSPGDVVVVTGSIYLLGEVLGQLVANAGPGEGRLQDF